MNLFYEALKKSEGKDKVQELPQKKKKHLPVLAVELFIWTALIFALFKFPLKKKAPLGKGEAVKSVSPDYLGAAVPLGEEGQGAKRDLAANFLLGGIIYDREAPLAVINGKIMKKKDKIGEKIEIIEITPDKVKLLDLESNTEFSLTL